MSIPSRLNNYLTPAKTFSPENIRVLKALQAKKMFKLICGASYLDYNKVFIYSKLFAQAGAHIIDLCAHPTIVTAAREGIKAAQVPFEAEPAIMVSLSLDGQQDPHFKRVAVNQDTCDSCGACVPVCPTKAFAIKEYELVYSQNLCYGCGACIPLCHVDALYPEPIPAFQPAILPELWKLGARALEIHVGPNFYWLESFLYRLKEISPEPWLISICLGSGFSSYHELLEQTEEVHRILGDWSLIQVDGNPLSGFAKEDSLSLQALASAQAILASNLPLFVQVSGGINDRIQTLAKQFNLEIHGAGMGSFVRKQLDFCLPDQDKALQIAQKLVNSIGVN